MKENTPIAMGIININRESFMPPADIHLLKMFPASMKKCLMTGKMIDIGACSTRPGSTPVTLDEEWAYLKEPLK